MTASCDNSDGGDNVTPTPSGAATVEPAPVNLIAGPRFIGEAPDDTLTTIAAGDFNGDGDVDLALGAAFAEVDGGVDAGKVYVFLSAAADTGEVAAADADAIFVGQAGDQTGRALAAADVNGDRVDDLIIGAPAADVGDRADAGKVYVLIGNPVFEDVRASDLVGNEPAINGADAGDYFGYTLTTGDFNDDGNDDLAAGAFLGDGPENTREDAGEVHVVSGGNPPQTIDLAEASLDAAVYGAAAGDRLSEALASGDFNGDRTPDLIAAAPFAEADDVQDAGATYVLTRGLAPLVDLARSVPGTVIRGVDDGDQLGHSLATLDFNGDGFDDLLLGAVSADGPENAADLAGEVALVPGAAEPPASIDAADLATTYGPAGGRLGRAVAGADVDGDGFGDALLGASEAPDADGVPETGGVYVAFGNDAARLPTDAELASLAVFGEAENDNLVTQVNGIPALVAADLNRDDLADVVVAAPRARDSRGVVTVYITEAK